MHNQLTEICPDCHNHMVEFCDRGHHICCPEHCWAPGEPLSAQIVAREAAKQQEWENLPVKLQTIQSLRRYADNKIPTGDFLRAVLENDLRGACQLADADNQKRIWHIVRFIYNELPGSCWGSPEKVKAWLDE